MNRSIQYKNEAFRQPNDICTNCGSNILKSPEMIIPYVYGKMNPFKIPP